MNYNKLRATAPLPLTPSTSNHPLKSGLKLCLAALNSISCSAPYSSSRSCSSCFHSRFRRSRSFLLSSLQSDAEMVLRRAVSGRAAAVVGVGLSLSSECSDSVLMRGSGVDLWRERGGNERLGWVWRGLALLEEETDCRCGGGGEGSGRLFQFMARKGRVSDGWRFSFCAAVFAIGCLCGDSRDGYFGDVAMLATLLSSAGMVFGDGSRFTCGDGDRSVARCCCGKRDCSTWTGEASWKKRRLSASMCCGVGLGYWVAVLGRMV